MAVRQRPGSLQEGLDRWAARAPTLSPAGPPDPKRQAFGRSSSSSRLGFSLGGSHRRSSAAVAPMSAVCAVNFEAEDQPQRPQSAIPRSAGQRHAVRDRRIGVDSGWVPGALDESDGGVCDGALGGLDFVDGERMGPRATGIEDQAEQQDTGSAASCEVGRARVLRRSSSIGALVRTFSMTGRSSRVSAW
mmetsp:Transcript_101681/g.258534  ORF Transcript_101681/g.258534 Transcript_101681/m.258534 type:complete len:190 (-) Transcript_101681:159-728(-)